MPVGERGRVLVQLINGYAITRLQVRMDEQVIAEVLGQELRDMAGLYFSVPRTPGTFNMTVYAEDVTGCMALTTAMRPVTVS